MICVHCGGTTEARKTVMQNGAIAIGIYCPACNRRGTHEVWVAKSRFTPAAIADMPTVADYTGVTQCQYRGCNKKAVEMNHYAPRYLFGQDCENYYIGPLCVEHHRTWHAGLKGEYMRHCPKCNTEMNASAVVEVFPEPAGWQFYGAAGHRFIRCRGESGGRGYVHFVVNEDGRQYHRLAYGIDATATPTPTPVQEALL